MGRNPPTETKRLDRPTVDDVRDRASGLSGECPLLVLVDDAHLADGDSALRLGALIRALAFAPVGWVLARRIAPRDTPGQQAIEELLRKQSGEAVPVPPLPPRSVTELCTAMLGHSPLSRQAALAARCAGNPLLLSHLVEVFHQQDPVSAGPPDSLLRELREKLADLPPNCRRLLEVAAMLPQPFPASELARVLGWPDTAIRATTEDLVALGLFEDLGECHAFGSEMLQRSVGALMPGPTRETIRRQVGNSLPEQGAGVGVLASVARSVMARTKGDLGDAVAWTRRAVASDDAEVPDRRRHARLWLASSLIALDSFEEADDILNDGQQLAEAAGFGRSWPLWSFHRAELRLAAGRLEEADAEARVGLLHAEDLGASSAQALLLAVVGQVALLRGDFAAARDHLGRAHGLAETYPEDLAWRVALQAICEQRLEDAFAVLSDVYEGLPDNVSLFTREPLAAGDFVRVAMRAGAEHAASQAVSSARAVAARNPSVRSLAGAADRAEGLLLEDAEPLVRAAEEFQLSGRPLAAAFARCDAGRVELAQGHIAQGTALLHSARAEYEAIGATAMIAVVDSSLRRRPAPPCDELTSAEIRVVRLAAEGLTNRAIADQLYLSPHTVDSHLRRSFLKVGVNSRVELTRWVVENHERVRIPEKKGATR